MSGAPYRGLNFYHTAEAPIFGGREHDVSKCVRWMMGLRTRIFILHGKSGCGKSSFLRAGLIPELDQYEGRFDIPRDHVGDPIVIRSGERPLIGVAEGIFTALGYIREKRSDLAGVIDQITNGYPTVAEFCDQLTPHRLIEALRNVAVCYPGQLILFVDQSEEIFTLSSREHDQSQNVREWVRFLRLFSELEVDLRLCISMRTEFKGILDDALGHEGVDVARIPGYYLGELSGDDVERALTKPLETGRFDFEMEPQLVLRIRDDVVRDDPPGGRLALLQLICIRLYAFALRTRTRRVSVNDYVALGGRGAHIVHHLEEALRAASPRNTYVEQRLASERWSTLLLNLVRAQNDGRVTTNKLAHSDLSDAGQRAGIEPEEFEAGIEQLNLDRWRIVRKVIGPSGETAWTLGHDAVGLALREWKISYDSRRGVAAADNDTIASASTYTSADLYTTRAAPRRLTVLDDGIWDHLLPLYGGKRGFLERVGFDVAAYSHAPVSVGGYEELLSRRDGPDVIAVPPTLTGRLLHGDWRPLLVCNEFSGFAVVGPSSPQLKPLSAAAGGTQEAARTTLRTFVERLADHRTTVRAIDEPNARFVKLLARAAGIDGRMIDVQNIGDRATSKFVDVSQARDSIIRHSLHYDDNQPAFVAGPANVRAFAEQVGLQVYADISSFERLLPHVVTPDEQRLIERELSALTLRNVVFLRRAAAEEWTEDDISRLVSALFYTVEFIRMYPDDFIDFIDESTSGNEAGRIDREFVRRAFSSSYDLWPFDDYRRAYLDDALLRSRSEAEEAFRENGPNSADRTRAWRHYHILNFRDAASTLARGGNAVDTAAASFLS